jgi:hypothetical protein
VCDDEMVLGIDSGLHIIAHNARSASAARH